MATDFDVEAHLRLHSQASLASLGRISSALGEIGTRIKGTESLFGGVTRSLVAMGAGYIGLNALVSGFRNVVGGAIQFQTQLESTRIGLSSVMSAVEGISFTQATERSQQAFDQLTEAALTSVATTQEMFQIYGAIYGPIRAAGAAQSQVLQITKDTVSAASALGVDFNQASRDVNQMLRGAAGMDVKLFTMLHSTGAIAEDAEHFNKLTQAQRVSKISAALSKFSEAAGAYATSWAGVTSSFRDIVGQLGSAAAGPIFESVKRALGAINDRLLANKQKIKDTLTAIGERIAAALDAVFTRAGAAFTYVSDHWSEIVGKIDRVVEKTRAFLPLLQRAAATWAAVSIGRQVVGRGMQAAGGIGSVVSTVGSVLGRGGGGAAAAGAGAAGAGAAGAGEGAIATVLTAIGAAAAPLAVILAAVGSAVYVVVERWQDIVEVFAFLQPVLDGLWTDLQGLGKALWDIARPIIKLIGSQLLVVFGVGLFALIAALRVLVGVLRVVAEGLAYVTRALEEYIVDPFIDAIMYIGKTIAEFFGRETVLGTARGQQSDRRVGEGGMYRELDAHAAGVDLGRRLGFRGGATGRQSATDPYAQGAPTARATVHNDFRGSRISVKQEFREADPDRILSTMVHDIEAQAERRLSSGFVGALTR